MEWHSKFHLEIKMEDIFSKQRLTVDIFENIHLLSRLVIINTVFKFSLKVNSEFLLEFKVTTTFKIASWPQTVSKTVKLVLCLVSYQFVFNVEHEYQVKTEIWTMLYFYFKVKLQIIGTKGFIISMWRGTRKYVHIFKSSCYTVVQW